MTALAPVDDRACRVSLDVFDGPLDLLLNLVRERRLDIATVPLAIVADQYFAYISAMESLDVELAADYLVIAATLVFLKSKALLPPIPIELEGEESAEVVEGRLRERLLTYSKYRDAGRELQARSLEAAFYYYREGGDPTTDVVQRYRIPAAKLAGALAAALREARPEKRTIVRERLSLVERIDSIRRLVRSGSVTFFSLCADADRSMVVLTFLAVLELIRRGLVGFEQAEPFADFGLVSMEAADAA